MPAPLGRRRIVAAAVLLPIALLAALLAVRPALVVPVVTDWFTGLSEDAQLALSYLAVGAVMLVVATAVMWLIVRIIGLVVTRGGPLYRAYDFVVPESPFVKMALGIGVIVLVAFASTGLLTTSIGDWTEERVSGAELATDRNAGIFDGDAAPMDARAPNRTADSDGDGIPDAWERRGTTPDGGNLPEADPDRMDLYVHVAGDEPLSANERDQLRSVWADMPVANPDGSTGVALHIRQSSLDDRPTVTRNGTEYRDLYTEDRLGAGHCVARLVVLADVDDQRLVTRADAPGYAAAVDARENQYVGSTTFRVAAITHALLHTVAGETHTQDGWLSQGTPDEQLSGETAAQFNESGFQQPASYPGC
jgi:hypothetical protein